MASYRLLTTDESSLGNIKANPLYLPALLQHGIKCLNEALVVQQLVIERVLQANVLCVLDLNLCASQDRLSIVRGQTLRLKDLNQLASDMIEVSLNFHLRLRSLFLHYHFLVSVEFNDYFAL